MRVQTERRRTISVSISSEELARMAAELSLTKKADNVLLLDLRKLTSVTDFFVICSASTDRQVKAIAEAIEFGIAERNIKPWHREGLGNLQWVLLDYVDVVAHVFQEETRQFYSLERLWGDAEIIEIKDHTENVERTKS